VPLGPDRDEVAAQAPIVGLTSLSPTLIAKANLFTLSYFVSRHGARLDAYGTLAAERR
jgi:hypothetical protein